MSVCNNICIYIFRLMKYCHLCLVDEKQNKTKWNKKKTEKQAQYDLLTSQGYIARTQPELKCL